MDCGLIDWKFDRSMELRKKEGFFSQSFANGSELTIKTKYFNISVPFIVTCINHVCPYFKYINLYLT